MPKLEHGLYYHIYNRGINSCQIFRSQKDYQHFLDLHKKYIDLIGDTLVYCIIPNHFHLLIKIKEQNNIGFYDSSKRVSRKEKWILSENPTDENNSTSKVCQPDPSRQFSHLFNAYSKYFNLKYKRTGSLFEKNFHRIKVDSDSYLRQLVLYIHFNPLKHGLSRSIEKYLWSSYSLIIKQEWSLIQQQMVDVWFDGINNFLQCHNGKLSDIIFDDLIPDE
jgi:putative transposase